MFYDISNKLYVSIDNYWFDLTCFHNHPGGIDIFKKYHLLDATNEFNRIRGHSDEYVSSLLHQYAISNKLLIIYLNLIITGTQQRIL